MTSFQYVIFDLDGTLVDSFPGIEYSVIKATAAVLPDADVRGLRNHIGPPIRPIFERLFADIGASTLDRLEREFRLSYDHDGWRHTVAYANTAPTLRHLARLGVPCFVATNKPLAATLKILDFLNLDGHFQAVVAPDIQDPSFATKTALVDWLLTSRKLPREPGLFVGDSADDRAAARHCGLHFALARYGYGHAGSDSAARALELADGAQALDDIVDLVKLFPAATGNRP